MGPKVLAFRLDSGVEGEKGKVLKPLEEQDDPFPVRIEDLKRESGEVWYDGMSHEFKVFGDSGVGAGEGAEGQGGRKAKRRRTEERRVSGEREA